MSLSTDWSGRITNAARRLATAGCDLLFPPRCVNCGGGLGEGQADVFLCAPCLARLVPAAWNGCPRCGSRLSQTETTDLVSRKPPESGGCQVCKDAAPNFDRLIALGGYDEELRDAVLRMKRPTQDAIALAMGRLLAARCQELLAEARPNLIIPIPMHWARRLRRGGNSPEVLAGCLAKAFGAPARRNVLVRRRHTAPQWPLTPQERHANLRGAFRLRRPAAVKGARVLLVDDILTTGATCNEAARLLKQAGAATVAVAIVARASAANR
jgi:ComF family protein